jgi:serralysin
MASVYCSITGDSPANTLSISGDPLDAATFESGEPSHGGSSTRSIWYRFQTTVGNNITIDASASDFSAWLAVYTGTAIESLTSIVNGATSVSFTSADTDYYLAITDA